MKNPSLLFILEEKWEFLAMVVMLTERETSSATAEKEDGPHGASTLSGSSIIYATLNSPHFICANVGINS